MITTKPGLSSRSLRDLYFIFFRHQRKVILFFAVMMATIIVGTMTARKIYLSEAKLMVRIGRESVALDPIAATGKVVDVGPDRVSEINSEIEILRSRELMEEVVEALGVRRFKERREAQRNFAGNALRSLKALLKASVSPIVGGIRSMLGAETEDPALRAARDRYEIVNAIGKNLSVEVPNKSSIVNMAFEADSPSLARDVVNKLVELYLAKHINVHRTAGSHQFFKEQTDGLRVAIEAIEKRVMDLKNEVGMGSLDDQRKALFDRIGTLELALEQTGYALAAAKAKVAALHKSLAGLPKISILQETTGFPDSAKEGLLKSINDLQLREQELLSTYQESNIQVQELRRQIRQMKELYAKGPEQAQVTQGVNAAFQQTELSLLTEQGNLASLEAQWIALKRQLAEARKEVIKLNEVEIQLAQLNRELDIQNDSFRKYSDSLEQTRINQALEIEKISNISVVQSASYPLEPIRPKKATNLLIGLVLSIVGGIGVAFLAEHQDHSLKRPEDVESKLDLPVLATIPEWNSRPSRSGSVSAKAEQAVVRIGDRLRIPRDFGNHWDPLRESMEQAGEANDRPFIRSCVVTAWRTGEGVTTVASQLAVTVVCRQEGRVLLVDNNFLDPRLHTVFNCRQSPGLADMLMADSIRGGTIQATELANLDFLSCGTHPARSQLLSKTIDPGRLASLLNAWYKEYRLVVFDTSPLGDQAQSNAWAALADAVVWVIEAEGLRYEILQNARDRLRQDSAKLLGVALNKRRYYIPAWLYQSL